MRAIWFGVSWGNIRSGWVPGSGLAGISASVIMIRLLVDSCQFPDSLNRLSFAIFLETAKEYRQRAQPQEDVVIAQRKGAITSLASTRTISTGASPSAV
jgi:hypothetical protein